MKEFIDKLIRRFEEEPVLSINMGKDYLISGNAIPKERVVEIVTELAEEYKVSEMPTGWIPCSERLPEVDGRYLCSYNYKDGGKNYVQVLSYYAYEEKPHFQHEGYEGLEVVAWCELPAPYTEGE